MNSLTTVTSGVTTSPILVKSDGWLLIQPASGATATVEYTLDVGNIVTVGSATWVTAGAFTSNTALRVEEELQDLYVRITSASGSCTYSVEGQLSHVDKLALRYYTKRYINSVAVTYLTNSVGSVTGLVKPDATTYGLTLGPVLYSALPAAASYSGYMCKVSDVGGSTGSLWISDGVRWKPVNGAITLYSSDSQSAAVSGVTETIQRQIMLPAGLLAVGDRLVCKISQSKSSTSETATTRVRIGTAGTVSDTQIAAIAAMATTNVSIGWTLDMRVNSATALQKMGGASTALPWGASTAAFPAATTVTDVTANALYLSFSSFMSSTVETTRIEDLVIELHTTTT